jgi:hypothetical protein
MPFLRLCSDFRVNKLSPVSNRSPQEGMGLQMSFISNNRKEVNMGRSRSSNSGNSSRGQGNGGGWPSTTGNPSGGGRSNNSSDNSSGGSRRN